MVRILFAVPFAAAAVLLYGIDAASAGTVGAPQASSMTSSSGSSADFAQDGTYQTGFAMSAGQENVAPSGSLRDANGNLIVSNGLIGSSNMSSLQGGAQAGVGSGWNSSSATAIGNQLNVVVVGSWNTVIVDSKQVNNGDQTASTSLNGHLNF